MFEIKLERILFFSSQDSVYKAENLLTGFDKWIGINDEETKQVVTIKLKEKTSIRQIDIENESSAFIEIQVGNEDDSEDDYTVLLPAVSFMTPSESKNVIHTNRLKIFIDDLNQKIVDEKWEVIKIICTQPFNRSIKFGIKSIKAYSQPTMDENKKDAAKINTGMFELKKNLSDKDPVTIGGTFRFSANEKEKINEGSCFQKSKDNEFESSTSDKVSSVFQKWKQSESIKKVENNDSEQILDSKRKFDEIEKSKVGKQTDENNQLEETNLSIRKPTETTSNTKIANAKPNNQKRIKPDRLTILNGVVFVLSGFVNPERSEIRDLGLKLGARYRPEWDDDCTHLICAFSNTPKAVQVRKVGGKVVDKKWLEDCENKANMLDCNSYIIEDKTETDSDSGDDGPRKAAKNAARKLTKLNRAKDEYDDSYDESEAENSDDRDFIVNSSEEDDIDESSMSSTTESSSLESEDSDRKKKRASKKSKKTKKVKRVKKNQSSSDSEPEVKKKKELKLNPEKENKTNSNEKKVNKKEIAYEEDNQNKKVEKKLSDSSNKSELTVDKESWELPDIFGGKNFYVYGDFERDLKKTIERTIIGFGGEVENYMGDNIDFVITDKIWNDEFKKGKESNDKLVIVGEDWISACARRKKLISYKPFEVEEC